MVDMTKRPTASQLDKAHRAGQEEAAALMRSHAYKRNPGGEWTSPFLSEAVQSWTAAKAAVLSRKSRLAAGAQKRHDAAAAECAKLSAPRSLSDKEGLGYLGSRREAKRLSATAKTAQEEAKNVEAAERTAEAEILAIDNCFRAWAQAFMEGVWSVSPALVDLVRPFEVSREVVDRSVTALMTDAARTQELLLACGIAMGDGPGTFAKLPGMGETKGKGMEGTLYWKENEHV